MTKAVTPSVTVTGKRCHDDLAHRLAGEGLTEVPVKDAPDVLEVLDDDRVVEVELLGEVVHVGGVLPLCRRQRVRAGCPRTDISRNIRNVIPKKTGIIWSRRLIT